MTPIFSTNQSQCASFSKSVVRPTSVVQVGHHRAQLIDRQSSLQTSQKEHSDRIPFSSHVFSSSSPLPLSNIYSPSTCQIDTILKAYIHFNCYMKRIRVEESHRTKSYLVYFERLQRIRIHVEESNRTKLYLVLPSVFKRTRLEAALVNI